MAIETATLGGGCFWCLEAPYQLIDGIHSIVSGYAGGHTKNPSYREVTSGLTGHAEVVQLEYDPELVSYSKLLEIFFSVHDPTTLNRQGADVGTQYRSIIVYHNDEQKNIAEKAIAGLQKENVFDGPVVTQVVPLDAFYPAEAYHQNYYRSNPTQPYCSFVVKPKVDKVKRIFAADLVK
jgi:peptide-methionine (S)-S-oxide reductase